MGIGIGISPVLFPFSPTYSSKVLGIQPSNLLAYWRLNEASGSVADNYEGTAARDGAYTGVTLGQTGIGDGLTCPLFDGANDYVDIYSASLGTAFNKDKGTLAGWYKISGASVLTDSSWRYCVQLWADNSNYVALLKSSTDNTFNLRYRAGGTLKNVLPTITDTGWVHLAITWDTAADEIKAYVDGVQSGATLSGLGVWAGSLAENGTNIGSSTEGPAYPWDGYLAHYVAYDTPLVLSDIQKLATV